MSETQRGNFNSTRLEQNASIKEKKPPVTRLTNMNLDHLCVAQRLKKLVEALLG